MYGALSSAMVQAEAKKQQIATEVTFIFLLYHHFNYY